MEKSLPPQNYDLFFFVVVPWRSARSCSGLLVISFHVLTTLILGLFSQHGDTPIVRKVTEISVTSVLFPYCFASCAL